MTRRELVLALFLYAGYAVVNLHLKLRMTPEWFGGVLERNHELLLRFEYTNNEQSRILQFYVPELIRRVGSLSVPDAYQIQRYVFILAWFCLLHLYLRGWFDRAGALLGVSMQAALTLFTHGNDLQESAPLLATFYVAGLWALREERWSVYSAVLLFGAMANETSLSLGAVHFFYGVRTLPRSAPDWKRVVVSAARAIAFALPAILYSVAIRYVTRHNEHLGGAWHWPDNSTGMLESLHANPLIWYRMPYVSPWIVFGPIWVFAFMGFRTKPLFLRCASLIVPIFIAAHMLTGIIHEARQMLPLGAILIPMAVMTLLETPDYARGRAAPPGGPWGTR